MNTHCDAPGEATAIGVPIAVGTLVRLRLQFPERVCQRGKTVPASRELGPCITLAEADSPHNPVLTLNIAADYSLHTFPWDCKTSSPHVAGPDLVALGNKSLPLLF